MKSALEAIEQIEEFPRLDRLGAMNPVSRMVEEIVRVEQVPYELAAAACLGALSAACGRGIEVEGFSGRRSRGNLFVIAGAETGTGKSRVWKHAFEPLRRRERELVEKWQQEDLHLANVKMTMLEKKIKQVERDAEHDCPPELVDLHRKLAEVKKQRIAPQLTVEDATPEALQESMQESGEVLALVSSDGRAVVKNVLGRHNKNGETEEDAYLPLWSGDPVQTHRISRPTVFLESPCLALCVAVQPDKLDQLYSNKTLRDSGFLQRTLPVPTNVKPLRLRNDQKGIDPEVEEAYSSHLYSVIDLLLIPSKEKGHRPQTRHLNPSTITDLLYTFNQWIALTQGKLADMTGFVMRWAENTLRIAVCLHVTRPLDTSGNENLLISDDEMDLAINIQMWFASKQLQLLAEGRDRANSEQREKLVQILSGLPERGRSLSELKKRNGKDEPFVQRVVANYPEEFEICECPPGPKGGRPSKMVRMKPLQPVLS